MQYLSRLLLLFVFPAVISLTGCADSPSENLENSLAGEIQRVAHGHHDPRIDMEHMTAFAWDTLHIFGPYTSDETIRKRLGVEWPMAERINLGARDDVCLLVFMRDGAVTRYTVFPRSRGNFADVARPEPYTPDEAVFTVAARGAGSGLVIQPAETLTIEPLP